MTLLPWEIKKINLKFRKLYQVWRNRHQICLLMWQSGSKSLTYYISKLSFKNMYDRWKICNFGKDRLELNYQKCFKFSSKCPSIIHKKTIKSIPEPKPEWCPSYTQKDNKKHTWTETRVVSKLYTASNGTVSTAVAAFMFSMWVLVNCLVHRTQAWMWTVALVSCSSSDPHPSLAQATYTSNNDWLIDWLIDWIVFYAVLGIFQPYNGGISM